MRARSSSAYKHGQSLAGRARAFDCTLTILRVVGLTQQQAKRPVQRAWRGLASFGFSPFPCVLSFPRRLETLWGVESADFAGIAGGAHRQGRSALVCLSGRCHWRTGSAAALAPRARIAELPMGRARGPWPDWPARVQAGLSSRSTLSPRKPAIQPAFQPSLQQTHKQSYIQTSIDVSSLRSPSSNATQTHWATREEREPIIASKTNLDPLKPHQGLSLPNAARPPANNSCKQIN